MQLIIDVSTWTQTEKNYLQAAAVSLLFQTGVTYDGISVRDGIIDITNPSADVSSILTVGKLKEVIVAELEKMRIATETAMLEAQVREQEVATSQFSNIKLAQIDAAIDGISNLAELKVLLKKFVRFVVARS